MTTYDIICVGAGPTGLACAMDAKRAGMSALVIDKGCLCNSIYNYPVHMVFFTTPELLEIGNLPMVCGGDKPTRLEALKYYRKGAEHYGLELRLFFGGHLFGQVCHGVRIHSRLLGGRFGRFLFHFESLGDIFLVAVGQCFLCL